MEEATALYISQIHPVFVGEVTGVDLRQPLNPAVATEIDAAMDRYAVLVLRGQSLDQEQQMVFARSFGPLDLGLRKIKRQPHRFQYDELIDISNVDEKGRVADRNSRKIVSNIANQLWHSDSSFQRPAAKYSMLSAVVLPTRGGETEFADLRAAYDALSDEMKAELEGLEAEHYALHSRFLLGDTDYTEEQKNAIPPVHWAIVRMHPGSKRLDDARRERDPCHPPFLGELTSSGGSVSSRPSTQSRKCPNQSITVSHKS